MEGKSETIGGKVSSKANGTLRVMAFAGVVAVLGGTIFLEPLRLLGIAVLERHGSSHGFFVPVISAYLLWLNWDDIRSASFRPAYPPAFLMVGLGLALFYLGHDKNAFRLACLAFIILSAGLLIVLFGRNVFKLAGFPVLFLTTMIPLTDPVYAHIADLMRTMTTWGSVGLLKLLGIPNYREGYDLYLQNQALFIAYGCSGIRYLLSYLVFGTAYAFRFKDTFTARLAVVAAAIPMAIFGGIIRLFAIFVTTHYIGPIFVTGRPHVLLSWSVFMAVLVAAIAIDQVVSRKGGQSTETKVAR
jgi:exosortase